MHLIHPAQCLEQGSCSRNVTVFGVWTFSWGSWEPLTVSEEVSDIRALRADIVH